MASRWAICDCGKWGDAPANFREILHFMKCECGKLMFYMTINPREAGYTDKDKIVPTIVRHDQKL